MENIRAYNNMFSMTSFGARIDEAVNDGRGPYVFKVSGQVSHWIGSICPPGNEGPRFLQLYIYDTMNEVCNRLRFFDSSERCSLSPAIVSSLSHTLNSCNEYVRLFKSAADLCDTSASSDFSVRLFNNVGDRRYEPPASGTLGGIVFAEDSNASDYDIVVHSKDGPPHRVSKLHPSYIPLQYPLLFPYAEPGWSPQLRLSSISTGKRKNLTVNMYYSFQIHDRDGMYSLLLNGGRLFQQYLVDAYTCIEQSRLEFINSNQNIFRSEFLAGVYDAIARGDNNAQDIGKRVFLPSSFTGGPRYMYKHYHDALAICRVYGNPQYFVTFTCNVKWPEITRYLDKLGGMQAQDRPDIIARVFRIKVQQFLKFMRSNKTFGDVAAELYTIEFQKRGLPHCHTLLWVTSPFKVCEPEDVDRYIRAEIPDPTSDPALHKIVTDLMMHGPCGLARPTSPCMRENRCSKSFPKSFESNTRFDKDGYVRYRRRDTSERATKNGIALDNRYVVPYNEQLCRHFNAHINVEHCGWNMMIKYLFKYISKGADRVRFCIARSDAAGAVDEEANNPPVNEIKNFVDGRYICPHEASWRILNFPIHERTPAVEVLAVHLQDMQNVTFKENLKLQAIVRNPSFGKTTLTGWFESNKRDSDGLDLTYLNYSSRYRWYKTGMCWLSRVYLQKPGIGRLAYVHPASGELFFLRMLLSHQHGCKSFADIRTVSNVIHNTYRSACDALGLLGDDKEWLTAFIESSASATPSELRVLFVHMLLFCEVSQPIYFWEKQWRCMGDDFRLRFTAQISSTDFFVNDSEIQQYILLELEKLLNSGTPSKSLADFGLPMPSTSFLASIGNRLLMEETCYDRASLAEEHSQSHLLLNFDQLQIKVKGDGIEATAEVEDIEYFDSVIKLESCYKVDGFICSGPRTYKATVNHSASLVIGKKARFHPVTNPDIPTVYFNFATYETIKTRIKDTKLLTDYIGCVVKNRMRSTSNGTQLRKTRLRDEMGNELEITLWPEKSHLIGDNVTTGDIVAITSTMVTEYNGLIQLESQFLTTVTVNPDMPQTAEHVQRLKAIPPMQSSEADDKAVTLLHLNHSSQNNFQGSRNFTCQASIKQIHEERTWYYVVCSKCSRKLYQEEDNGTFNYVCKNDDDITPNFRYAVNATITDATASAEAIFFDDSMQALLNISCKDMVTKHADITNPKALPDQLKSAIGTTKLLHVTLKNDGKIAVNNVSEITSTNPSESTSQIQETPTFTPTTPIPKKTGSKRQVEDSPGEERKMQQG
ncbi:hypothetical protein CASFOL_000972 [Castilleja foliolosa]|uniref:DNA helicase n=1 Tax=Castilleja foliolosa TaxID=1961234 RepID=A0ABD3ELX7_9LAMI